jgi:general secretion pathway protein K
MPIISVLWSIVLLSVAVTSLLFTSNISYSLAHNASQTASTNAIGEAAINRAVLALLDPRMDKRWPVDGTAREFDLDTIHIRLLIQDELGRIDLNHADRPLLMALFQSTDLETQAASNLVDKILDWRDTAPLQQLNGAKDKNYRDAGYTYRPRNGPFQSVDELKLVMGMTPDLFKRVEPALTVYSERQFVDPQIAPREVLAALPTMNADKVTSLIAARSQQDTGQRHSTAPNSFIDPINALKGRAFTIRAEITTRDSIAIREATIRLTGNPAEPYWMLNWQQK